MPEANAAAARLHGVDAIRGLALVLGVVLHATMSFFPGPSIWVVADSQRSAALSALFYVIHVLRMATFFFIAGYFARVLHGRLGTTRFVRDRLLRIGVPLVLWWPVSLGTIIAVAAAQTGGTASASAPPLRVTQFPLTHLWFLYVLLWLYVAVLLVRAVGRALDARGTLGAVVDRLVRTLASPWSVALLALPVAWALYSHPYWLMWFGVPTPDMSLVPNRAALVTYGATFAFGWLVQRQSETLLPRLAEQWRAFLALAVLATVASLVQIGVTPVLFPVAFGPDKARYAMTYAVALWSWVFALFGIGLHCWRTASARRRYLADASYWIYLAHLPLVITLQWLVAAWSVPWWVKLPLIVAVSMTVLLASYHWLVRATFIGAVLHGRRRPRRLATPAST